VVYLDFDPEYKDTFIYRQILEEDTSESYTELTGRVNSVEIKGVLLQEEEEISQLVLLFLSFSDQNIILVKGFELTKK
jgi:hypothetical protein